MVKLLFVCKDRNHYGTPYSVEGSYGLINSCKFVGRELKECFPNDIEYEVVSVFDANKIDREVWLYKPDYVFIQALWVTADKMEVLIKKYPQVNWVVRIHSKAPFLANEGIAMDWINKYVKLTKKYDNFEIAPNDASFCRDLEPAYGIDFVYLPNIYKVGTSFNFPSFNNSKELNIGCFGAIRPMKNQFQQAIAAINYANECGKRLRFHMNGSRTEQKGENVLKNIKALFEGTGHELVLHPWYNHSDFLNVVKTMDLGLQVSLSESFNIVSADFVAQDIPVVVSYDITWANCLFKANPNSVDDIVDKMKRALRWRRFNLQYLNKLGLKNHNSWAFTAWVNYLSLGQKWE